MADTADTSEELKELMSTLSIIYTMTKNGTVFGKNSYIRLVTSLPSHLVVKLKLAPIEGLDKRLNHLMALHEASLTGTVSHIEGVGVDYNVFSSDICIEGVEIDYTADARLVDMKREALKEKFSLYEVVVITRQKTILDFNLPSVKYFDMYKNISFDDSLENKMNDIMDAVMDRVNVELRQTGGPAKTYKKPLPNFDNNEGMAEWSEVSKVPELIKRVLKGFSNKSKTRITEVSAANKDDRFTTPLIEALRYGTNLVEGQAFSVELEDKGNIYTPINKNVLNERFAVVTGADLVIGYSKYENCLRAIFSNKFGNYTDVSERIKAKVDKPERSESNRTPNMTYNSVGEIMADYNDKLKSLIGKDESSTVRRSYATALSSVLDGAVEDYLRDTSDEVAKTRSYEISVHMSEIAKSVAAAQKFSSRPNEYRLGQNGDLASYTLTQMTGTNDSFETANYIVMYAPKYVDPNLGAKAIRVVTPFRTMSRNAASWRSRLPETLINLCLVFSEANNYDIGDRDIAQLFLYAIQNNNNFSSMVEQTRYLFVSATSKKEVVKSVFEKKISSVMFHKNIFQAVHILKMLKMAEVVTSHAMTGTLEDIMSSTNYEVYMPAIDRSMTSFQDCINASYLYTCFNKFATFKLARAAKVYDDLLLEKDIYDRKSVEIEKELDKLRYKDPGELLEWMTLDKESIINSTAEMILSGPDRFQFSAFSLLFMMRESKQYVTSSSTLSKALIRSPIDACTMRGGMTDDVKAVSMACRAAETITDGITNDCARPIMDIGNVSIYALKCVEMVNDRTYMNRIVDKDQVGNRDISVLNYSYRIGALFCETVTRVYARSSPESVLNDPAKATKFHSAMESYDQEEDVMDTNDQSRWGPNALMELFYLSYQPKVKDRDILIMMAHTFEKVSSKLMRVPDNVIRFMASGKTVKPGTIVDVVARKIGEKRFIEFEFSMGQGILHQTSDLYHVSGNDFLTFMSERYKLFKIVKTLITSDDCFRILKLNGSITNWKKIEAVISGIMGLLNIIRNPSKSFLSSHIGEFNSEFYSNSKLVIPTIKKAVSEIDIGSGISPMTDLITATMRGSTSLADGASLVLSDAVGVASLALTIDQWNYYNTNPVSVLKGGLPAVSSLVAMISGAIGVVSLTDGEVEVENAFKIHLTDPAVFIDYVDTIRTNDADVEARARRVKTLADKGRLNGQVLVSKDISNIVNLVTYKKNATSFTNMIKSLTINDVTLDRYNSTGRGFLFNLKMQFSHVSNLGGGHDYFKRMTDPSRSVLSKCFRAASGELLNRLEYYNYLLEKDYPSKEAPEVISNMITSAIERAMSISQYTCLEDVLLEKNEYERRKIPNKIILDEIAEISKDEAMEYAFNAAEGTDLQKFMIATTLVNALYGTAPASVKVKLYSRKKLKPTTAVNSIIRFRTVEGCTRSFNEVVIEKGVRAMSESAQVAKEIDDLLERVALNYNMNESNKRMIYYQGTATNPLFIGEALTRTSIRDIKKSAANEELSYFTSDAVIALMSNRLLTQAKFELKVTTINLWYPEDTNKLAVVTEYDRRRGVWAHTVWGLDDSRETIMDRKGRPLSDREVTFKAITDTELIRISSYAPLYYTTINGFLIPIKYVQPKTFESKEEIDKYFDIPDVEDIGTHSIQMGRLADDIAIKIVNNEEVTEDELIQLIGRDVSDSIINRIYRILGQNMYTSRNISEDEIDNSEEDSSVCNGARGISVSHLFEMMEAEDDEEMTTTIVSATTMSVVNIDRARDSLGYKLHLIMSKMRDMEKIKYTKQLLLKFDKKLIGCVLILSRYRVQNSL